MGSLFAYALAGGVKGAADNAAVSIMQEEKDRAETARQTSLENLRNQHAIETAKTVRDTTINPDITNEYGEAMTNGQVLDQTAKNAAGRTTQAAVDARSGAAVKGVESGYDTIQPDDPNYEATTDETDTTYKAEMDKAKKDSAASESETGIIGQVKEMHSLKADALDAKIATAEMKQKLEGERQVLIRELATEKNATKLKEIEGKLELNKALAEQLKIRQESQNQTDLIRALALRDKPGNSDPDGSIKDARSARRKLIDMGGKIDIDQFNEYNAIIKAGGGTPVPMPDALAQSEKVKKEAADFAAETEKIKTNRGTGAALWSHMPFTDTAEDTAKKNLGTGIRASAAPKVTETVPNPMQPDTPNAAIAPKGYTYAGKGKDGKIYYKDPRNPKKLWTP